jgi:gluconolactonase
MELSMNISLPRTLIAAAALLAAVTATAGPVFPEAAKLQTLYEGGSFTEGVAAGPDGNVYFVDVTPTAMSGGVMGYVMKFDPRSGKTSVFRSPSASANGMKFDREGRMVVALGADFGGRALIRTDLATARTELVAGLYNGKPFNSLNDVAIDKAGRMYVTDPRYIGHEPIEQPVWGVYRIDPDGKVTLLLADVQKPNGVAVSPDGRRLYVAEHFIAGQDIVSLPKGTGLTYGPMRVLGYDLDEQGRPGKAQVLVDYGNNDGPDGLLTDAAGNLYVAERRDPGFGIGVYRPDGGRIDLMPTPAKPTNLAFGRGANVGTLYITAGKGLYRVDTTQRGWDAIANR